MRQARVTWVLVALNVLVWAVGLQPANLQASGSTRVISRHALWEAQYGVVPCEVTGRCANHNAVVVIDGGVFDPAPRGVAAQVPNETPVVTLVTAMFVHGGFVHLALNMLVLAVFGSAVEAMLHRVGFLGLYLLAGVVGSLAQVAAAPSSTQPIIGASGAIAGLLGAFVALRPHGRVLTLVIPPIVRWVPGWLVVGVWAALQVFASWRSVLAPGALTGGVAYVSHVVGFVIGAGGAPVLCDRSALDSRDGPLEV